MIARVHARLHALHFFSKRVRLRLIRECFADFRTPQQTDVQLPPQRRNTIRPSGPLHICLFIENLGAGGAERQLVFLAKALAARGHTVEVLCATIKDAASHYLSLLHGAGIPLHVADRFRFLRNRRCCLAALGSLRGLRLLPVWLRPSALAVLAFLLDKNFDVLHTYLDGPNCVGGVAGLLADIPVIRLSARSLSPGHASNQDFGSNSSVFKACYNALLKMPHISLEANSRAGAVDYAHWLDYPQSCIDVAHNGIPLDFLQSDSQEQSQHSIMRVPASTQGPTLLCVQRMSEEKCPLLPVQVLTRVRETLPEARLLYVGTGPLWDEVRVCIAQLRQEDTVSLLGARPDIARLLRSAQVFLLTSRREGFPNVLMEAMLAGLPAVAVSVGGVPELIKNGTHGVLLPPMPDDSPEAREILTKGMAEAIIHLWEHPESAREMGAASRTRIRQDFSVERLAERTEKAYLRELSRSC